jgi:hypothetical protein
MTRKVRVPQTTDPYDRARIWRGSAALDYNLLSLEAFVSVLSFREI